MRNSGTLSVSTPSDCEIQLVREFAAPRTMVFDALTKPELLRRWFGPRGWTLAECEAEVRVGGSWRYVLHGPTGEVVGMRGVYRELAPPERIVNSESFDAFPGESIVTTLLVETNGRTTLTSTIRYASREVRDAVVAAGMEHGAAESYDRMAELLEAPRG